MQSVEELVAYIFGVATGFVVTMTAAFIIDAALHNNAVVVDSTNEKIVIDLNEEEMKLVEEFKSKLAAKRFEPKENQ